MQRVCSLPLVRKLGRANRDGKCHVEFSTDPRRREQAPEGKKMQELWQEDLVGKRIWTTEV